MVEWRAHLASLGAVFLALALGIVIGLGLGGDEAWTQRQQAALDRIEAELNASRRAQQALLARQAELLQETEGWRLFATGTLPRLARGLLDQQTVGVAAAPGEALPQELLDLLGQAGARVVVLAAQGSPDPSAGGEAREAGPARLDALVVVTGRGAPVERLARGDLLPEGAPEASFGMLILPDRFPDGQIPVPDGWAAVGPLDHPAAAWAVVLSLASRRPGRYGWSPEGPRLP